ncbi:MAG: hypothetical protein ABI566_03900 [Pseudolysinimonas sp.]
MTAFGFDQTNGMADGLQGDDDGGIAPPVPEATVLGLVQKFMGAGNKSRGTSATDHDPSITAYGEEGAH